MDYEQLKHKNSADTQTLAQPYQPIVYAIPKAQWEAMLALMTENLPFMDAMATDENMAYYYQEVSKALRNLTDSQNNHQREMSSQAGKMSDQNSKWVRDLEASLKNQAERNQKNLWKKMIWIFTGQSIFLALMMTLLTLILR